MIENKTQSYALYEAGKFGNKFRTWSSLEQIVDSGYTGRIVMRYKGRMGGASYPGLGYPLAIAEAAKMLRLWLSVGAREKEVVYNESAPDNKLLIQGEVMLSEEHISLFWSDRKVTMREAMKSAKQLEGLRALMLLKTHLYPSSWADLEVLLERFPTSVVEFSAYRVSVGNIPGRNAVIWEVRDY